MDKAIIIILKLCYVTLASVAQERNCGRITAEQARELADNTFQSTASEIHSHRVSNFVTDN